MRLLVPILTNVQHPQTSSLYVLLQAAACRRALGDIKEAAEIYEHGMLSVLVESAIKRYSQ